MRNAFVRTITRLAEHDPSVMLVIGDTGFGAFEEFEEKFPGRFINVGIAEQQFISFSAGLALSGMKVFAYNVCTFMSRAMEQIRLELSYQLAPVVLVGVGAGFWYGTGGPTHHAMEDISQLRALPNMNVLCPADPIEMEVLTEQTINLGKPCYLRICKNNDPVLYELKPEIKIGKSIVIKDGADIALIATGGMVREALKVSDLLAVNGLTARVISMHTVKPIDKNEILRSARECKAIFTMEENTVLGGLGGAVAETLVINGITLKNFSIFGFPDTYSRVTGTRDYLNGYYGLDAESMANSILKRLGV